MLSRFSHVRLPVTAQTAALQASPSMGLSRQEPRSRPPSPPPEDPPDAGIEPESPVSPPLQVDSLLLSHWGSPIMNKVIQISVSTVSPSISHEVMGPEAMISAF